MALILLATGVVTRLAEVSAASAVRLTTVAGGGLLSPQDLVGGDQRRLALALLRLLLPGLALQALLVKLTVEFGRDLRLPYLQTLAALGLVELAALGAADAVSQAFAHTRGLGALAVADPVTVLLALAITAGTLLAQAWIVQGLVQWRLGAYPVARRANG
jgi:hypothetical protein